MENTVDKIPKVEVIDNLLKDISGEISNALGTMMRINGKLLTPIPVSDEKSQSNTVSQMGWFDETILALKSMRVELRLLNQHDLRKLLEAIIAGRVKGIVE